VIKIFIVRKQYLVISQ